MLETSEKNMHAMPSWNLNATSILTRRRSRRSEGPQVDERSAEPRHLPPSLLLRAPRFRDRTALPQRHDDRLAAAAPLACGGARAFWHAIKKLRQKPPHARRKQSTLPPRSGA